MNRRVKGYIINFGLKCFQFYFLSSYCTFSILNFAKDADYTLTMADQLLDRLTGGEHSQTKSYIEERRAMKKEEERWNEIQNKYTQQQQMQEEQEAPPFDVESMRQLSDFGIDVSFLDGEF